MKTLKRVAILLVVLLPVLGWSKTVFPIAWSKILLPTSLTKNLDDSSGSSALGLDPGDFLTFSLDDMVDEIGGFPVLDEYLPNGIDVEWTGKRFKTPKAGVVKYSKKEGEIVTTSDENPCGFRVSISKKKGKVTGSFKVYVQKSEKKVKAYTAKIAGYVGSDLTVTIKKVGSFTATLD